MKKTRVLLIAIILILLGGFLANNTYAAKNDIRNLAASLTRPFADSKFTNPKYQYTVAGEATDILYTIVKIYDNNDKVNDVLSYAKALYCLRGGVGFGAEDVSPTPVNYTEIGEMHIDAKDIIENYMNKYKTGNEEQKEINIDTTKEFRVLKTAESPVPTEITKTVNLYNAILWIIDESYLPTDKINGEGKKLYDASEYKAELLDKAGVPTIQQADITDNDIEVIQQLAIWYFTNYDEQEAGIKPTVSQSTKYPAQFISINEDDNVYIENDQRGNNLDRLYQYFIYGAIENADKYEINETTGARQKQAEENKFDKSKQLKITSHDIEGIYDYYEVGPIIFEGNASDNTVNIYDMVMYDANGNPISKEVEIPVQEEFPGENGETIYGEITSGGRHIVYKFLDSDGNECTELIKGKEYKIRIYKAFEKGSTVIKDGLYEKYDISKITLKVASKYNLSTATFLSAGENSQPVVEIDKEKVYSSDEITTEIKEFDLALRKYIIEKNGVALEVSREPKIDTTKLNTFDERGQKITTAIYDHIKEPLEVEAGDLVKYRLATYNEGDINGYVYSIKDYIPEYLEFVPTAEFITQEELNNYRNLDTLDISDEEKQNLKSKVEAAKYVYKFNSETRILEITKKEIEILDGPINYLWMVEAFKGRETLDCKYLDVTFKVSEEFVTDKNMYLTNVATMTYGSKGGTTADEPIIDRDSNKTGEEFTVPTEGQFVSQNKTEYKGNTANEENLNLPEYHYEGQQDDDDFEKLVIKGKEIDLALRKYIIEKNGVALEVSREPKIDTSKLNTFDEKGQKITTAIYNHIKEPLEVEAGDLVKYRLATYNEGDINGYVYSIKDYIPNYLEFVPTAEFITQEEINNYKNLDTLDISDEEKQNLKAKVEAAKYVYKFNSETRILEITKKQIEMPIGPMNYLWMLEAFKGRETLDCKYIDVTFKVSEEFVTDKNMYLTNVATMTYGSKGGTTADEPIIDRDSNKTGEEFTVPTEGQFVSQNKTEYKGNTENQENLNLPEYHYEGQQDDDDFEKLVIKGKEFDLALRKYIMGINGTVPEEHRVPQIDTSKLNTIDEVTGKEITTAIYKHSKEPLIVRKGDIVTYKIRIYNEGKRDGYATKVTDYLPEGLGFLYTSTGAINSDWFLPENVDTKPLYGTDGIYASEEDVLKKVAYKEMFGEDINLGDIQVIQGSKNEDGTRNVLPITAGGTIGESTIKATGLIKAYGSEKQEGDLWQQSTNNEKDGLFYQELEITCIVLKENTYKGILKNVAEITAAEDSEGNKIVNVGDDRDSEPNNVYQDEKHTPGTEVDNYTPGEQDDDDFEPLQLKYFDLALRKFITGVETNGEIENITSRIPAPKFGEDGNIVYEHTKDPVMVANNDIVTYTIRIYNEGTLAGYAEEVTDDIPEGLEYLPEHDTNKEYKWVMIDKDGKETEDVKEAEKIVTDYLSEANGKEQNLIAPFDSSKTITTEEPLNPDYRDIKVSFKVTEPNTSDRIIVNSAQISEDSDDDIDSIPDKWNEGEDDQDKEYIYVKYFDLSLLKWVTKTIVTVDGKTTTTVTGFKPNTGKTETTGIRGNEEAEPIAKVELDKKKLNKTTVKFAYQIRVTNEGEIPGYATEITDFIPEGLEFLEEDNKAYGWTKEGENKVTTRALETKLLNPGESAELEIVFTWKNNEKNLGLKTNIAEITEDYNENNSKDIDSVPDNKVDPYEKEQEDDDDFALVILSIKTGKGLSYTLFITSMIALLAAGMYLIKKYILIY